MDDETRTAFAALMTRMNDLHERLIIAIRSLRSDFKNTNGFLIEDSLVLGQRTTLVENRLDRLEKGDDAP